MQMMDAHFKPYQEEGRIGRVEYLPVCWHSALHSDATGVDRSAIMIMTCLFTILLLFMTQIVKCLVTCIILVLRFLYM